MRIEVHDLRGGEASAPMLCFEGDDPLEPGSSGSSPDQGRMDRGGCVDTPRTLVQRLDGQRRRIAARSSSMPSRPSGRSKYNQTRRSRDGRMVS